MYSVRRLISERLISVRRYHQKVLDHYNNPKNVGSLNKDDKNVGTGLVGAPACIHKDTKIAVADGRRIMTVEDLYLENKIVQVWSYNINKHIYEIKDARIIKNSIKKPMKKIIFDDDSFLICTDDHKFLLKNNKYLEVNNIKKTDSIVPFKRSISKRGYWEIRKTDKEQIKEVENLDGVFDCYDIQVEENNNFAVITKETQDIHSGIIIHNCGDVMKLQIKVDDDGKIIDAKFKTFGCLAGNVKIATPTGYIQIKSLSVGDIVYAWNGKDIVENEIEEINHKWINYTDLLRFEFEGSCHFKFICSTDHIWWLSSDKPVEANDLKVGDELIHITENELRSRNNIARSDWMRKKSSDTMKLLSKKEITKKSQLRGLEMDGNNVKLYDIRLKEGANVFFAGMVGTHNCGSAIASSSYVTTLIKDKNIDDAINVKNIEIAKELNLPPVKLHCSMLAEDAVKAAVNDYKSKQQAKKTLNTAECCGDGCVNCVGN